MAAIKKGVIPLELGGISYTLTLDLGAIMAAEQQAHRLSGAVVPWDELVSRCTSGHVSSAVVIFWALFQRKHPEITIDRAADIVETHGLDPLVRALSAVMVETKPDERDLKELGVTSSARPRRARAGTGASTN